MVLRSIVRLVWVKLISLLPPCLTMWYEFDLLAP